MAPKGVASKRDKYTPRACDGCRRRKVKCSGEIVCSECRIQGMECVYTNSGRTNEPRKRCKRPRLSFPEQNMTIQPTSDRNNNSTPHDEDGLRSQLCKLQQDVNNLVRKCSTQSTSPVAAEQSSNEKVDEKARRRNSFDASGKRLYITSHQDLVEEEDEDFSADRCAADILTPLSPWPNSLAVWSQIKSLRTTAGLEADLTYQPALNYSRTVLITLPEPAQLNRLVGVFFREFECYFPCIYRPNIQRQLRESLKALGYSSQNRMVQVGPSQFQIMAILCSMLACVEAGVHSHTNIEWPPGHGLYSQGAKLMEFFQNSHDEDANDVLYHTLSALFLFRNQSLRAALQHILRAYQTAIAIGLNDQSKWEARNPELTNYQSLWWILYYLDKRITQKSGIAYFIREKEVAVKDFRESSSNTVASADSSILQSLATYSRLWTYIWDNFFSANAPKAGNWDEIELIDARILVAQQHIPPHLVWQTDQIHQFIERGEPDVQIRRRLICFLRYKYLRLCIRHKKVTPAETDALRRQSCFQIAKENVEAVAKYMELCSSYHFIGFFLTLSLVDAIYYIAETNQGDVECISTDEVQKAIRESGSLLRILAQTISIAARAYKALEGVLFSKQEPSSAGLAPFRPMIDRSAIVNTGGYSVLNHALTPPDAMSTIGAASQDTSLECSSGPAPVDVNLQQANAFQLSPPYSFGPAPPEKHTPTTNETTFGETVPGSEPAAFRFDTPDRMQFEADMEWNLLGKDLLSAGFSDQSLMFDHASFL